MTGERATHKAAFCFDKDTENLSLLVSTFESLIYRREELNCE